METLKTLFDALTEDDIAVFSKKIDMSVLRNYCYEADMMEKNSGKNTGYGSIKWFIYSLRENIREKEKLLSIFKELLQEACGSDIDIYTKCQETECFKKYRHKTERPKVNSLLYHTTKKGYRVAINMTGKNLTSYVLNKGLADIIVFCNAGSAGFVFDQRKSNVIDVYDVEKIFESLKERGENWVKVGKNLVLCGGHKNPESKTSITVNEMIKMLESDEYIKSEKTIVSQITNLIYKKKMEFPNIKLKYLILSKSSYNELRDVFAGMVGYNVATYDEVFMGLQICILPDPKKGKFVDVA